MKKLKRKLKKFINNRRYMAAIAAFLFASDIVITMMASNVGWFNANAASTESLVAMKTRAEAIINYEWTPSKDIRTWNNSLYNGSTVFPKGVPVKGVPFCLFTSEVVPRSQLTLSEYKSFASKNYSTTAICKSTKSKYRTGPVYGSCCAGFVSEVMGKGFMGINVESIATSSKTLHITNAYASQIRVGDAIDKKTHIIWIGDITDEYFVIYEQTPPVAHKVLLKKSESIDSSGRFRYKNIVYSRISRYNLTDTNPSITAPSAHSTYEHYAENAEATINWANVTNASYYLVDVTKDGEKIVDSEAIIDNSYAVNKGNGNYEVYITAVCGTNKKTSNCVSFSIGRLDTPEISNTTECYESGEEVTIDWNSCTGATGYNISIYKDDGIKYVDTDLTANSYTFQPEDGYYEARVEAINNIGGLQKTFSDKYSFFVGNKRQIVIDSSITHFAHEGDVDLKWNECDGVSDYTLVISQDGTEVINQNISGSSSYAAHNLPDGHYKAVVSAVESTGEYEWLPSKSFSFYVGVLDIPVVVSDAKYHPLNSTASVSWKKCAGAVGYHIEVSSQNNVVFEDNLSGTKCTFDVESGKYSVTVTAVNTNGGLQKCQSDEIEVWAVSLDIEGTAENMHPGDTASLRAVVSDHDSSDRVSWTSTDSDIVSVSSDGTLTANGIGTATVKAHFGDLSVSFIVFVSTDLSFETLGASIRLSEPYGIRFGIRLEKDDAFKTANIEEYGTLIIPESTLGENDLTLDTKDVLKIKADTFLENTDGHLTYTGVLINIPKSFFDTKIVGRGYLKYRGLDGEVYTLYSQKVVKSFNNVVQSAYDSYTSIEEPNASQLAVIKKLQSIIDAGKPEGDENAGSSASDNEQP